MLVGLAKYSDRINQSGLAKIEYAPIHLIDRANARQVISDTSVWLFALPFLSGSWLEAKILPIDDGWQQSQRNSKQGEIYEQNIRGIIPELRQEAATELCQMASMRFVVKVSDRNQQSWLIGSLEQGLIFNHNMDTGSSNGGSAIEISFSGLQRRPAPIYGPG